MRERAKKSPFYLAMQIGNLRIGNLRMRRKKLRKPSYAYMRMLRSQRNHSLTTGITSFSSQENIRCCNQRRNEFFLPGKPTKLKQSADKDEEIRRHQPSSPAAASSCRVTQTSPSTFVPVAVARAVAVVVAV